MAPTIPQADGQRAAMDKVRTQVVPPVMAAFTKRHAGKAIMEMWRDDVTIAHLDPVMSNVWQSLGGLGEAGWKCLCRVRYDGLWCGEWRHKRYGTPAVCRACGDPSVVTRGRTQYSGVRTPR